MEGQDYCVYGPPFCRPSCIGHHCPEDSVDTGYEAPKEEVTTEITFNEEEDWDWDLEK